MGQVDKNVKMIRTTSTTTNTTEELEEERKLKQEFIILWKEEVVNCVRSYRDVHKYKDQKVLKQVLFEILAQVLFNKQKRRIMFGVG